MTIQPSLAIRCGGKCVSSLHFSLNEFHSLETSRIVWKRGSTEFFFCFSDLIFFLLLLLRLCFQVWHAFFGLDLEDFATREQARMFTPLLVAMCPENFAIFETISAVTKTAQITALETCADTYSCWATRRMTLVTRCDEGFGRQLWCPMTADDISHMRCTPPDL